MRILSTFISAALLIAGPATGFAQEDGGGEATASASVSAATDADSEEAIYKQGGLAGIGLVVGLKPAVGFGSALGGVGAGFGGELEVGFLLPPLDRSIEIFATGRYQYDTESGEGTDNRLENGDWSYDLTRKQGMISLGGLYRLNVGPAWVAPYGALGARMYLWETKVSGESGGETYGTYTETATDFGGFVAIGADFFIGPGSILVEVHGGFAPVDGYVLRDTNAGGLSTLLGYRMYL
jgi:hypothetical protein